MLLSIVLLMSLNTMAQYESMPDGNIGERASASAADNVLRVVGYLPDWESGYWGRIDFSALTHCVFSFLTYNADGSFGWWINDSYMNSAVSRCKQYGVKTMIALGGGGGFDTKGNPFSTAEKRAKIINKLKSFVSKYGLDGVDVDIEVGSNDPLWGYFDAFVQELRTALGNDKLITMAVSEWFTSPIKNSTFRRMDFLNVMTYDYAFGDGPVAPYNDCVGMLSRYAERMGDPKKVTFGVPFYGYASGGATKHWRDIIALDAANRDRDFDPKNRIYYNGVPTITKKVEKSKEFGGIMIWELAEDDFGSNSMLKIVKDLIGTEKAEIVSEIPGKVDIMSYADKSYQITMHENGYAGDLNNGLYLTYNVSNTETGEYELTLPLAAGDVQWNAKSITVSLDDTEVATIPVRGSTGWENFINHTAKFMIDKTGVHKLKLTVNQGACNIKSFSLSKISDGILQLSNASARIMVDGRDISLVDDSNATMRIYNMSGQVVAGKVRSLKVKSPGTYVVVTSDNAVVKVNVK